MSRERSIEEISQALDDGEGCKIKGDIYKHFISNSFHIAIGNEEIAIYLMNKKGFRAFDLSHKINYMMLGEAKYNIFYQT